MPDPFVHTVGILRRSQVRRSDVGLDGREPSVFFPVGDVGYDPDVRSSHRIDPEAVEDEVPSPRSPHRLSPGEVVAESRNRMRVGDRELETLVQEYYINKRSVPGVPIPTDSPTEDREVSVVTGVAEILRGKISEVVFSLHRPSSLPRHVG